MTLSEDKGSIWIRLQHRFGPRLTEWLIAVQTSLFGYILISAQGIFAQPAWSGFARFMNQETLGWLMLCFGVLRLGGLIVNGSRRHVTPWIRVISASFGFLVFSLISFGYSLGAPTTALAIYPVFAIGELFNIWRASRDAGTNFAQ